MESRSRVLLLNVPLPGFGTGRGGGDPVQRTANAVSKPSVTAVGGPVQRTQMQVLSNTPNAGTLGVVTDK